MRKLLLPQLRVARDRGDIAVLKYDKLIVKPSDVSNFVICSFYDWSVCKWPTLYFYCTTPRFSRTDFSVAQVNISETHLEAAFENNESEMNGKLYRKDRNRFEGGVAPYIKVSCKGRVKRGSYQP